MQYDCLVLPMSVLVPFRPSLTDLSLLLGQAGPHRNHSEYAIRVSLRLHEHLSAPPYSSMIAGCDGSASDSKEGTRRDSAIHANFKVTMLLCYKFCERHALLRAWRQQTTPPCTCSVSVSITQLRGWLDCFTIVPLHYCGPHPQPPHPARLLAVLRTAMLLQHSAFC